MSNAQTTLTNRQYYAIHGNFGPAPKDFPFDPPGGKPDMPSTINQLNPQEQAALKKLIDAHENERPIISAGLPGAPDVANVSELQSDLAKQAYAELLVYYARPLVKQWLIKNKAQKEAAWKHFSADVHDEVGSSLIPVGTTSGMGSNATSGTTPVAP